MARPRTLDKGQLCSFWLDLDQRQALDLYADAHGHKDRSKALRAILDEVYGSYTRKRSRRSVQAVATAGRG